MHFRTLFISSPAHLSINNERLLVTNKNGKTALPFADITAIIVESTETTITTYALAKISEYKILYINCDPAHLPVAITLPLHGKIRIFETFKLQQKLSNKVKNDIWDVVVKNKISNQIKLLNNLNITDKPISKKVLADYVSRVKNGDIENIEGVVAQFYWSTIFSKSIYSFTRAIDDIRNAALNYGYAIVRAALARALSGAGFTMFLGLHHKNELNPFANSQDKCNLF